MKLSIVKLLLTASLMYSFTAAKSQQKEELWYTKPAEKWTDALPIGNGKLGAMLFSGVANDHVQFNEETLWTGKPRDYNKKGASKYLPEIRQLLFDGKQKEAEALAQKEFMGLQSEPGDRNTWVKEMKSGKGITGNPAMPNFNDKNWKFVAVPAFDGWETVGLQNVDGAVWFRTTFTLPKNWAGKDLILDLNRIRDQDVTYINGEFIGNTDSTEPRLYTISAKQLKSGVNTIAIQVLNYYDKGGILGYKDTTKQIGLYPVGESMASGISLVKQWKYKIQNANPPAVAQYQAHYLPFGDLNLTFNYGKSPVTAYKRSLDLNTAMAATSYKVNGIQYQRTYFASQPNQAVVIHLTASKSGSISFEAALSTVHPDAEVKVLDKNTLSLKLAVKDGALKGESRLTAVLKKGKIEVSGQKLRISNADEVTLYLTAGTNFLNTNDVSGNPATANDLALKRLEDKSYPIIVQAHQQEYQKYYNTFQADFGHSENEKLPTDLRLEQFASANDPGFMALYMQYGRYLLISSSRPGTQAANLQGIWNDLLSPPWGSKYTTNINLEMNYWPSEILNLSALNEPLFKKIEGMSVTGAETAKEYYNAQGWLLHHNTDLWNATAPINASNHGIWVVGGAWLSQHLWEHYLYGKDRDFLKNEAYPLMKKSAEFFVDFLIKDPKTGWLISTPSNSPENGGLVAGPTMDHQIIRSLFNNCIAAAKMLNTDNEFRTILEEKVKLIAPNQIGKYGQLQEWLTDLDDTTNKHRHVSHLWGVYPGNDISWDADPKMMEAAKQSLLYRGDEATGWSLAWKINFWARFKDGDHAMKLVKMLMRPAGNGAGSYVNLFDAHPPFQIDGNFGGAAGIAEMLMQSHQGYIELLPALPSNLPDGKVKGLRARGGFELDLEWENGVLKAIVVQSAVGGPCKIRYKNQEIAVFTEAGKQYKFNGSLK
ncbi:glycosyl hydrolase family 95 catalytic domain-containing protein [Pedobacter sp. AW1-32]|uniref:glycosyl hydrolase family 95 catalytic domain-containing protein n=1 Tax=Pedobacter sp. AW1-32 TaxID=3383026 RepID=UPI003FF118AC